MTAPQSKNPKLSAPKASFGQRIIMDLFEVSPKIAIGVLVVAGLIVTATVIYFFRSAPPNEITISSGPEGSVFHKNADKYAAVLKRQGVNLKVLSSEGSQQNLQRLVDPSAHVDVAIAQAGQEGQISTENLVSLASISYQPIFVFYRGKEMQLLSELEGKKVAVGPVGSGTRNFALALLAANGIKEGGTTTLLSYEEDAAFKGLEDKSIDAAFMMSENASTEVLRPLLRSTEIHLMNFKQANAYSRKVAYLNILDFPEGSIDLGKNIPPRDMTLLGPMVELVARKDLHPALSDLLLEAAVEVHNKAGTFQRRGDFPTPIEHAIKVSDDSNRFFKSGKGFLYRVLPFWLASLISRIIVVILPMLVVLVPSLKSIPAFFRWRIQRRIHGRYRELLALEREMLENPETPRREEIKEEFDHIVERVSLMNVPASFADQFYGLRGHIDYVRQYVIK